MFSSTHSGAAIVLVLISALLIPAGSFGSEGGDTALHAGLSSIFGAAGETFFHYKTDIGAPGRVLLGTFVGSLPGLAKELADSRFSGTDMAADVAGAFLGAMVANFVNTRLKVNVERRARKTTVWLTYSF